MQIHSSQAVPEGELPVNMNPGVGDYFGILHLGADVHVNVETDEDADRIVRAVMHLKAMRAALGKPHAHERGAGPNGSHCMICGLLKDATEHTAPRPCPAVSDAGTTCIAGEGYPHRDANDDGQTYSGDPDPFGPEAYKTHRPGCACPDCQAGRVHPDAPGDRAGAPGEPESSRS